MTPRGAESVEDRLKTLVAVPLRAGTLAAVALVAIGLVMSWIAPGEEPAAERAPLIDTILAGGAAAVVSIGLLMLTLVPLAVAIGAVIGLWRAGEHRYLVGSAVVAGLLVVSLLVSAVLLAPSA
jgi:uncharacterized membrane protein